MYFKCYGCGKDCEHGTWVEHEIKSGKTAITIKVPLCKDCMAQRSGS